MPKLNKTDIKKLIGNGDTEDALDLLLATLSEENKKYNKFTLLKGQWATAQEQIKLGLENRRTVDVVFNRITDATLSLLETLTDSDLNDNHDKHSTREEIQKIREINSINYQYDIFFSFSSRDIDDAKELCNQLRGYGLRVFFSADDMRLKGGHQFSEVIDEALENSCHFLLHCTPNSMFSEWVKIEYTTFHDQIYISDRKNRRFLILEGVNFSEKLLRISYRNIQRVKNIQDILNLLLPSELKYNDIMFIEEEKVRQTKLAEQKRLDEEKDQQANLAEQKRLEVEKEWQAKLVEQKRLKEEKERQAKLAEQKRLKEEKERQAKLVEQKRLEEEKERQAKLEEQKRLEVEKERQAYLAEQKRLEEKERQAKLAEQKRLEVEKERQAYLAEQKRLEEKERQAKLAEQKRLEEKERQAKLAEQKRLEEKERLAKLAEQKRLEEKERLAKLAEQTRLEEEKERQAKLAEQNKRLAAEGAGRKDKWKPTEYFLFFFPATIFLTIIFSIHYSIRIFFFDYSTKLGYWETVFLISMIPASVGVLLGMLGGSLMDTKFNNLGVLIMLALVGMFIIDFFYPSYSYYAFERGLLMKKEVISINLSQKGVTIDSSKVYQDSVSLNLPEAVSSPPKLIDSYHVIKKKETIFSISKEYQVPIDSIYKWNPNLNRKGPPEVGYILKIGKI